MNLRAMEPGAKDNVYDRFKCTKVIKIGSRVKIRKWNDMLKEHGWFIVDESIAVPGEAFFTTDMRFLCGSIVVVEELSKSNNGFVVGMNGDNYHITPEMLE